MTGVDILGPDQAYEGWVVNSDGPVSTGIMSVGAGGTISHVWTSPDGDNLIEEFDTVVISIEPVPDSNPAPSADKPFVNSISGAAMTHIRHLVVSWQGDNGILTNLQIQLDVAQAHAALARNSDNLDDLRLHTQHVINIIEGEDGANFEASAGNPGDGIGVLMHAQDRKHAGFAAAAVPGDAAVNDNADDVEEAGANAEMWAGEARDQALDILDEDSLVLAKTLLNTVSGRLDAAEVGIPATGKGGANQAYVSAQLMATYVLPPAVGTPSVGDATVPLLMQMALAGALVLLASGGFLLYRERRMKAIKA
jgi:hypothetical protein